MGVFDKKNFICRENNWSNQIYTWFGITIKCERRGKSRKSGAWMFRIASLYSEWYFSFLGNIIVDDVCDASTLAKSMEELFAIKRRKVYKKIIIGVLNGGIVNGYFYLEAP